jgi:prepilin-type N-terminal cleavage/methylation domain-containing protein
MADRRPRRAFTLGEVLIGLAIIAVLGAVIYPTIAAQVNKADPEQIGSDMMAVRTAIEQFVTDVRRYPRYFNQLVKAPTAPTDSGVTGGSYGTVEVLRWGGPYFHKDAQAALKTGYSLTFDSTFKALNLGDSSLVENAANPRYLVIALAVDSAKALAIDRLFDDGDLTKGVFRWTVGTLSAADTLKFLALPIQ